MTNTNLMFNNTAVAINVQENDMEDDNSWMFESDTYMEGIELMKGMKSEYQIADTMVVGIFINLAMPFVKGGIEWKIGHCQLAAMSMFKTLYEMQDQTVHGKQLVDHYFNWINHFRALNKDLAFYDKEASDVFMTYKLIECLVDMKFIVEDEDFKGAYHVTSKYIDMCVESVRKNPLTEGQERRVPYVKGNRIKPSNLAKNAMDYLATLEYTADRRMLEIAQQTKAATLHLTKSAVNTTSYWEGTYFLDASEGMDDSVSYHSEYDADHRGRMYHVASYGTNPQGSGVSRSIFTLSNKVKVEKGSKAHEALLNELNEYAKVDRYKEKDYMEKVVKAPVAFLVAYLNSGSEALGCPFMYVRIVIDLMHLETHGKVMSGIVSGLDAKCSGTQIYAIVTGNLELLRACGFSSTKVADPYELCCQHIKHIWDVSREIMKKPYMSVQYGGGIPALVNNRELMAALNLQDSAAQYKGAELLIDVVKDVLGSRIDMLKGMVYENILHSLEAAKKTSIAYKHTDGFRVKYEAYPQITITHKYSEVRYAPGLKGKHIFFGSKVKDIGLQADDDKPTAKEFARTFMVNWIQGIDALLARTIIKKADEAGIPIVAIHDCFRTSLDCVHLLKGIIQEAYIEVFLENDQLANLGKQLNIDFTALNVDKTIFNEEMIMEEGNYFFCQ